MDIALTFDPRPSPPSGVVHIDGVGTRFCGLLELFALLTEAHDRYAAAVASDSQTSNAAGRDGDGREVET